MLDKLYENIGGKVKLLAKVSFIVEAVASILMGFALMLSDGDMEETALYGFFVILLGPVVAFVSSWVLYAFGELVEKTCRNESNSATIVNLLKRKNSSSNYNPSIPTAPQTESEKKKDTEAEEETKNLFVGNYWVCGTCHKINTSENANCWYCNRKIL